MWKKALTGEKWYRPCLQTTPVGYPRGKSSSKVVFRLTRVSWRLRVVYTGAQRTVGRLFVPSVYFIHSYACNLSIPNDLSNVWESIYTSLCRKPHRRKADKFGRIVDHCGKSMTERMTERLNGDAQLLKSLLIWISKNTVQEEEEIKYIPEGAKCKSHIGL